MTTRDVTARLSSTQLHDPNHTVTLSGLRAVSNREFDPGGNEVNVGGRNPLAQWIAQRVISPADRWTVQVTGADNPFLLGVDRHDNPQSRLEVFADARLVLEYETGAAP